MTTNRKISKRVPLPELRRLANSPRTRDRLLALQAMRGQIQEGKPRGYLPLARRLIRDADNTCRWQALIVVGEFIESDPKAVWSVIAQHGRSRDQDLRTGVACVLLEHMLPRDFDRVFRELSTLVKAGNEEMIDTVRRCWAFGLTKGQLRRLQSLAGSTLSRPRPRASA